MAESAKPVATTTPADKAKVQESLNKPFNFNELVNKAEVIEGYDLAEKAELVGVEFVITGVWFVTGARNVQYVYMNGVKRDGSMFTFNDSSSGIRAQVIEMMNKLGKSTEPTGEIHEVLIHIPRGVRVSEYEITDVKGKERKARTYYLTTGGQ